MLKRQIESCGVVKKDKKSSKDYDGIGCEFWFLKKLSSSITENLSEAG